MRREALYHLYMQEPYSPLDVQRENSLHQNRAIPADPSTISFHSIRHCVKQILKRKYPPNDGMGCNGIDDDQ